MKTVVIVGGSSGLGKALATQFAQHTEASKHAYKVFAAARRLDAMQDLAAAGVSIVQMDVLSQESCISGMQEIVDQTGPIDILICNAGIASTAPLLEEDIEEVLRIFQTNTLGVLRCIQAVAPGMVKRGCGQIVVVGSITAFLASPFNGAYAASKAALHIMTETLRMELQPFGVNVSEVWAGTFKTEINAKTSSALERYNLPSSLYQPIYNDIQERSKILELQPNQMSPQQVAQDIVKSIKRKSPPHFIKTGTGVGMYTFIGFLQSFVWPNGINAALQDKFGLKKLKKIVLHADGHAK